MSEPDFHKRLEAKVLQQLRSQRVGFLMGAGSSYLNGSGYPLASTLWDLIRDLVPKEERADIEAKLDQGASGLEQALDLLDSGGVNETSHRRFVTSAIAARFQDIDPTQDLHVRFLKGLVRRNDKRIPVFSLNYDPLLERAAENARIRMVDGFWGTEHAYFDQDLFQQDFCVTFRGHRGPQAYRVPGIVWLIKLHGSLGWYECPSKGIRRCRFDVDTPEGTKRLMIPPQHRKAAETTAHPYATLWSEFRGMLRQGPYLLNRLVAIGYGMGDEHVNAVIDNGLARTDLTLMITLVQNRIFLDSRATGNMPGIWLLVG